MPAVSVIIPNYNHARYLRRRVESVLGQTYQDFEVILLDDGSTDDSRGIIASYEGDARVTIAMNAANSGSVFKQWNKGVQMARGRYVWIAESDDYAEPGFLMRMAGILEQHADVSFAYCRSWRVGEDDQRNGFADEELDRIDSSHWKKEFLVDGAQELRRYFTLCDPISNTSAVLFRKERYEAIGGASEELAICGDYRVWAEMAGQGKIAYAAEAMNFYRCHSENVRTRTEAGALGVAEYFYVMLGIVRRMAVPETVPDRELSHKILGAPPIQLSPSERIFAAKNALSQIAEWNLKNNPAVSNQAMRAYFMDWQFALVGKEFAIKNPNRWQFFLHRCRFYRHYFAKMNWALRVVNLMRVIGAPVVGYRNRHWPEEIYARAVRMFDGG